MPPFILAGGVAQVIEQLPSKGKDLCSNPVVLPPPNATLCFLRNKCTYV
jgi:hypothetical protein